jgi:hypothetical protein
LELLAELAVESKECSLSGAEPPVRLIRACQRTAESQKAAPT